MKLHPILAAGSVALALAACTPLAAEYTESEAPKVLTLDNASANIDVRFAPGSARLLPREAARLRALATGGGLVPSDRIVVAASGGPALAAARFRAIAATLLRYGIVASKGSLAGVPPNRALIESERYVVTLPPCPDWSKQASLDFTNTLPSNFGCANIVDLGQSVVSPADLAEGQPVGLAEGEPATSAVQRYLTDKVQLPTAASVGPIAATSSAPPAAGGQP